MQQTSNAAAGGGEIYKVSASYASLFVWRLDRTSEKKKVFSRAFSAPRSVPLSVRKVKRYIPFIEDYSKCRYLAKMNPFYHVLKTCIKVC